MLERRGRTEYTDARRVFPFPNGDDDFRAGVRGRLRLTVPRIAETLVLMPLLPGFMAAHPQIELEVVADDGMVDIVADDFDAGIRFGEQLAADMVALPIGAPAGFCVVASPAYLRGRSTPRTPDDLLAHVCLRQRFPGGALYRWEFERDAQRRAVSLAAGPVFNGQESVTAAALAGLGIAYVVDALVAEALADGRLVQLMPEWMPPPERFYLYTASRRQMPAPLRSFIDFARARAA